MTDDGRKRPAGGASGTGLRISRRTVLAAAAVSGAAGPGPPVIRLRVLNLTSVENGTVLVITESEQAATEDAGPANRPSILRTSGAPIVKAIWPVPARVFGDRASFDFEPPGERTGEVILKRVVIIRNAAYGGPAGLPFRLVLERKDQTDPWSIALSGTPWQSDARSASVPFERFVHDGAALNAPASSPPAAAFLGVTLANRIYLDAKSGLHAGFDRDCAWSLTVAPPASLAAFGGAVRLSGLRLGWTLDRPSGKAAGWVIAGHATGTVTVKPLPFGGAHRVALTQPAQENAELSFRAAVPSRGGRLQTVVCLSIGGATLDVHSDPDHLVGPLPCHGLTLTDTVLPDGTARQTISAAPGANALLKTPIGRLWVAPPEADRVAVAVPPDQPAPRDAPNYKPALPPSATAARLFEVANGDKGGDREADVFVVHDAGTGRGRGVRRIDLSLALLGADTALPDVSDSKLTFAHADLRIHFEDGLPLLDGGRPEHPRQLASSWIWAGPIESGSTLPRGVLDLSRATLGARRDLDLLSLAFRFHDLALAFAPAPHLRPAREDCRMIARTDGVLVDSRPLLIIEFPPQHVMEEAVFRPAPPPLPDFEPKDVKDLTRTAIEAELAKRADHLDDRVAYRTEVQNRKIAAEAKDAGTHSAAAPFTAFARKFADLVTVKNLPESARDQRIYVGPFALDPDLMAAARELQRTEGRAAVRASVDRTLKAVADLAGPGSLIADRLRPVLGPDPATAMTNARANEAVFEQLEPLYGLYRDLWRDEAVLAPSGAAAEYLTPGNRPKEYDSSTDAFRRLQQAVPDRLVKVVLGEDTLKDMQGARLSSRSRLAFRVNCTPLAGLDAIEAGVSPSLRDGPAHPGAGSAAYDPLPFTLASLTDWSRHEPEVTRRARRLFRPLKSGVLPPLGLRAAEADDLAVLADQGIARGLATADQRMAMVRATLVPPTAFETAIELPSRLVLSTAQDAVWLATRRLPRHSLPQDPGRPQAIWTARLSVSDATPGVRAVWSPDLRPLALCPRAAAGSPPPGHGAPPRGPWAPWLIGPEQSDTGPGGGAAADGAVSPGTRLLDWLRKRAQARNGLSVDPGLRVFRTSLDAWDRHNIVLQSSAYGLPVTGARTMRPDGSAGDLVTNSGMFEPGEDYALLDAQDGDAVYRPVPLDVRELTLTSLGGSLVHSTTFVPAGGALLDGGGASFDGFSIQRWQHEVVLGRDVRAEVVYKGYLMPFCHRSALVKLTERTFLRTPGQGIKAVLRQRMFLQTRPDLVFPLPGQPHEGRLMCGRVVTLGASLTPDLLDPTAGPRDSGDESVRNGRITLDGPGLAFWPRTDATDAGLLRFECLIDGAPSRAPMLFLDKVAATTARSLESAVKNYNAAAARRTFPVNGLKLRFAPEMAPGDTSLATTSIRIRVHGRMHDQPALWTGNLGDFANTPVLEGADQPPFFPAMESAEVRLEQLERLTGAPLSTEVQYDGHYVRYGFLPRNGQADAQADDPDRDGPNREEVFLDLRRSVKLDMGANGDRTGGIGRPNGTVIAVSRTRGPISTNLDVEWKDGNGKTEAIVTATTPRPIVMPPASTGFESGLGSVAWMFNTPAPPPAPALLQAAPPPPLVPAASPPASPHSSQNDLLKSLFDSDARLLGVVTLQELMGWVAAATGLPELKEAIDYGTKALQSANAEVDAVMAGVRRGVLLPLHDVVQRLRAAWQKLDDGLRARRVPGRPITVGTLFPGADAALNELDAAVERSLAATDPFALGDTLGQVFAVGRRLVHEVAVMAAHPAQRLQEAVERVLDQQTDALLGTLDGVRTLLAADLERWAQALASDPEAAANALLALVQPDGNTLREALLLAGIPMPPLAAIFVQLAPGSQVAAVQAVRDAEARLRTALAAAVSREAGPLTRTLLTATLGGPAPGNPTAALRAAAAGEVRAARAALALTLAAAPALARDTLLAMLDQAADGLAAPDSPLRSELAALLQGCERVKAIASAVERMRRAAARHDLQVFLGTAATLARDTFGVNLLGLADDLEQRVAAPLSDGLDAVLHAFPVRSSDAGFERDRQACADGKVPPMENGEAAGSTVLLRATGRGILAIEALGAQWTASGAELPDPALGSFFDEGPRLCVQVAAELRGLFCDVVAGTALLAGLSGPPGAAGLDALRAQAARVDALQVIGARIAAGVGAVAADLRGFANRHAGLLAAGALAALLVRAGKDGLAGQVAAAERRAALALGDTVDEVLGALRAGGQASAAGLDTVRTALAAAQASAAGAGVGLDPEASQLSDALSKLAGRHRQFADLKVVTPRPATLVALLGSEVTPGQTLQAFVAAGANGSALTTELDAMRAAETAGLALMRRVQALVRGLPDTMRARLEGLLAGSQLIARLVAAAKAALDARNDLARRMDGVPAVARRLLVPPTPLYGTIDPSAPLDAARDRLAQEGAMLAAQAGAARIDPKVLAYLASWGDGTAAPLQIAANVARVVTEIAQGRIVAALDLGGFRDAIENALTGLVPTTATLSYDFSTTISHPPAKDSIFQPDAGAPFGIEVRGVVDLLHPDRTRFGAKAHLGPFDILLIGGVIDALRLSFGGLSFEASTGSKARFDVAYRSFEIGEALSFAKQLQPFLGPKDGNGPFVRPLRTGLGIEAGYGVDLGTIGIGVTSFFNVKLGLSAELPFDDNPALFKVSLGLPMAPFSMSVVPFAGSGYFAILADGKGPIGFEASFQFGMGGAVGFGILNVVARVQVGLFVRLEVHGGKLLTTVSGTFFAGGSASIWIFSFSTSLYVRLGQQAGGKMEGEAIFTFSFSLGFIDYDYSVTVFHSEAPIGGRKEGAASADARVQYAQAASAVATDAPPAPMRLPPPLPDSPALLDHGRTKSPGRAKPAGAVRRTYVADQSTDWARYAQYFDPTAIPPSPFPDARP